MDNPSRPKAGEEPNIIRAEHIVAQEAPASTNWENIPGEIQQMIIENMDFETKSIFAKVSKKSEKQVFNSKNFIYGIQFKEDELDGNEIHISTDSKCEKDAEKYQYSLVFMIEGDNMVTKRLKNTSEHSTPEIIESEVTNMEPEAYSTMKFPLYVDMYSPSMKLLRIDSENAHFDWSNESQLKRLRTLDVSQSHDAENIILQTKRPLKNLMVRNIPNMDFWQSDAGFVKICNVKNCLLMPNLVLTAEQFRKLRARSIEIKLGGVDEPCLVEFITKWRRNELHRQIKKVMFAWGNDQVFDMIRVYESFNLLGNEHEIVAGRHYYVFQNNIRAELIYRPSRGDNKFIFRVDFDFSDDEVDSLSGDEILDEAGNWSKNGFNDGDDDGAENGPSASANAAEE